MVIFKWFRTTDCLTAIACRDANEDADVTARMENFKREGHPRLDLSVFVRDATLPRRNVLNLCLDFLIFRLYTVFVFINASSYKRYIHEG